MATNSFGRRVGVCVIALGAAALAACSSSSDAVPKPAPLEAVVVVGFDGDQSQLLTEIYAQALEQSGYRVGRKDPVTDLAAGYAALVNGEADLFVTYTGQLLAYTAAQEPSAAASTTTPAETTTTVGVTTTTTAATTTTIAATTTTAAATATTAVGDTSTTSADTTTTTIAPPVSSGQATAARLAAQIVALGEIMPTSLQFGAPSTAQVKTVIACANAVATADSLATLSDLAKAADHLTLGATSDFATSEPFDTAGFGKIYEATFDKVVTLDVADIAAAVTKGDVDCGAFGSLDVTITRDMSVLEDDLGLAVDDAIVPLLSEGAATPGAVQIVDSVSKALTTPDLREMMRRITVEKQAPNVVAGEWLRLALQAAQQ